MIPGEIFTSFAELQGIVSGNDFRIPVGFQELLQAHIIKFVQHEVQLHFRVFCMGPL